MSRNLQVGDVLGCSDRGRCLDCNVAVGIVGVAVQVLRLRLIAQTSVGYVSCVSVVTDIEDQPRVIAIQLVV